MKRNSLINAFGPISPINIMDTSDTFEFLINAKRTDNLDEIDNSVLFDLNPTQHIESCWATEEQSGTTHTYNVHAEIIDTTNNTFEYRVYIGFNDHAIEEGDNSFTYYDRSSDSFTRKESKKILERMKRAQLVSS